MHQPFITGFLLLAVSASAADLRVGRAAVEIPPFRGEGTRGSYAGGAGGVHDPAHAKALVLESGGVKAAMVVCDVIGVPREVVEEARNMIEKDTWIPGGRVMISATHTHTGPSIRGGGGRATLPALIAQSVKLAAADLKPAQAAAGAGREESLVFNRRFLMRDGTVRFNPGKLNPDIVRPVGPVDPTVAVVYFESAEGRPLATYVNYPMHLDTVGGDQVSADYPYTLSTLLEKTKGEGMLTVFSMGTSGNVNHLDVKSPDRQKGHGEAARIGTVLAGEVLKTYTRLAPVAAGALDVRSRIVKLPLLELQPGEVEKAKAMIEQARRENRELSFLDRVYTGKVLRVAAREGQPVDAEVQVIALGRQVAWVGLPGEIFVELGMAIKAMSPFPHTIVVSLAGDSLGYVPDRRAYVQGAYEVLNSRLAPGGGELMVDAAVEMLRELWGGGQAAGLPEEEKRLGFQPLFNGKDLEGWEAPANNWEVRDGAIAWRGRKGGLNYIAAPVPEDFELRFEWKVAEGSNSGVYYRPGQYEYQVLDNQRHRDGTNPRTNAASIYGAVAPSKDATRPPGQWNEGRIVCRGSRIEHWLNGEKVVDVDYRDPKWQEAAERMIQMGTSFDARPSRVYLQDHGDPVWYRNIRLRGLTAR